MVEGRGGCWRVGGGCSAQCIVQVAVHSIWYLVSMDSVLFFVTRWRCCKCHIIFCSSRIIKNTFNIDFYFLNTTYMISFERSWAIKTFSKLLSGILTAAYRQCTFLKPCCQKLREDFQIKMMAQIWVFSKGLWPPPLTFGIFEALFSLFSKII